MLGEGLHQEAFLRGDSGGHRSHAEVRVLPLHQRRGVPFTADRLEDRNPEEVRGAEENGTGELKLN